MWLSRATLCFYTLIFPLKKHNRSLRSRYTFPLNFIYGACGSSNTVFLLETPDVTAVTFFSFLSVAVLVSLYWCRRRCAMFSSMHLRGGVDCWRLQRAVLLNQRKMDTQSEKSRVFFLSFAPMFLCFYYTCTCAAATAVVVVFISPEIACIHTFVSHSLPWI